MEVKPGYKMTEVGVIPEDWEVHPLGSLIRLQSGYSFRSENFCDSGVPVIRISDIHDGRVATESAICHLPVKISSDFLIRDGDSLVAMSGATTGKVGVFNGPILAYQNQRVGKFVVRDKTTTLSEFVRHIVGSNAFGAQLKVLLEQGAQPNVSGWQIESLLFPVPPSLPEQRAIAAALSDVDALLSGLDRLIAKKRDLKLAAMQQLLTGATRLPGFSGEWEVKAIQQIAQVGRGRVISHVEISKAISPIYPVFSSQTLNNGIMGYLSSFDFEGDYVTWTTDGANAGTVFARSGRFNCTNVCGTIKLHDSDYCFIAAALSRVTQLHVSRQLGNPKLMNNVMKKIEIMIPKFRAEQSAIAAVLSDMDAELAALEARRDKTRALKQAMMQELLTGRTRLV